MPFSEELDFRFCEYLSWCNYFTQPLETLETRLYHWKGTQYFFSVYCHLCGIPFPVYHKKKPKKTQRNKQKKNKKKQQQQKKKTGGVWDWR